MKTARATVWGRCRGAVRLLPLLAACALPDAVASAVSRRHASLRTPVSLVPDEGLAFEQSVRETGPGLLGHLHIDLPSLESPAHAPNDEIRVSDEKQVSVEMAAETAKLEEADRLAQKVIKEAAADQESKPPATKQRSSSAEGQPKLKDSFSPKLQKTQAAPTTTQNPVANDQWIEAAVQRLKTQPIEKAAPTTTQNPASNDPWIKEAAQRLKKLKDLATTEFAAQEARDKLFKVQDMEKQLENTTFAFQSEDTSQEEDDSLYSWAKSEADRAAKLESKSQADRAAKLQSSSRFLARVKASEEKREQKSDEAVTDKAESDTTVDGDQGYTAEAALDKGESNSTVSDDSADAAEAAVDKGVSNSTVSDDSAAAAEAGAEAEDQTTSAMDNSTDDVQETVSEAKDQATQQTVIAADSQNCQQACNAIGRTCDAAAGSQLNTEAKILEAARAAGTPCTSMAPHPDGSWQDWDGPWIRVGKCGWAGGAYTMTCEKQGSPGFQRLCICMEAPAEADDQPTVEVKELDEADADIPDDNNTTSEKKDLEVEVKLPEERSKATETVKADPEVEVHEALADEIAAGMKKVTTEFARSGTSTDDQASKDASSVDRVVVAYSTPSPPPAAAKMDAPGGMPDEPPEEQHMQEEQGDSADALVGDEAEIGDGETEEDLESDVEAEMIEDVPEAAALFQLPRSRNLRYRK